MVLGFPRAGGGSGRCPCHRVASGTRTLRVRCSRCAVSDVSSSMLYLARILRMGRSLSHHCSLGMRCLRGHGDRDSWGHPRGGSQALSHLHGVGKGGKGGTRTRNPSAGAARRWAGTPGCACASPAGTRSRLCWQRSGLGGGLECLGTSWRPVGNVWEPSGT